MQMDPPPSGGAGNLALWGVVITIVLAGFGGVYSIAQSVSEIKTKLDRNCGYIKDISIGLRLQALTEERLRDARGHGATVPFFPDVAC